MKRFLAAVAGALGLATLLRRRRRKTLQEEASPADELRTKLAEARSITDERDLDEGAETTVDAAPDPEARRREVHEQARQALDELQ